MAMYLVNVRFKKIEVSNYSPKAGPEIKVQLNDGKDRVITRSLGDSNPEALAEELFKEARIIAKKQSRSWDDDDVLNDVVVVRVENEDDVLKRMVGFLSRLQEKSKYIRGMKQVGGYLYAVENYKRQVLEF